MDVENMMDAANEMDGWAVVREKRVNAKDDGKMEKKSTRTTKATSTFHVHSLVLAGRLTGGCGWQTEQYVY